MKRIALLLLLAATAILGTAQTRTCHIYNIVTFEGDYDKEGITVKVDNGQTVQKLTDGKGKKIRFRTPAAALMYFTAQGWELCANGVTASGEEFMGKWSADSSPYWILRKPCPREKLEKAVKEGIKE